MWQIDQIFGQTGITKDLFHFGQVGTGSNDSLTERIVLTDLAPQISHRVLEVSGLGLTSEQSGNAILLRIAGCFSLSELHQDTPVFLFDFFDALLVNFTTAMAIAVFEINDFIDDRQIVLIVNNALSR